ncbi:hypothetical protein Nepgr_020644 [Nepenthes gracilis]|uniref:Protein ABCI12, chloroplastic n=1 Tax=Nepenthes gracilis TaxID=150966 RepID=A0AAD3SWK0_NEPGR|nr:hypothetical protein Nepgr_020644 [Nepenthes gracilis]
MYLGFLNFFNASPHFLRGQCPEYLSDELQLCNGLLSCSLRKSIPSLPPLRTPEIQCAVDSEGKRRGWKKWIPNIAFGADKVLRSIAGATSSPICQFIPSPTTFLHSVDPRIKLVWLLAFILLPARSHFYMRFGIVLYLALLSVWALPTNVWMDQLGRVILLSGILFIILALSADGAPPTVSIRTPPPAITGLPNIPSSFHGYKYLILKLGPLQITRKGLSVASTSACLTFTIFQSASLCLTTTTPEQLASALRWFMLPLKHIGVPVAEIILTLLLSLRFINLVFDEIRNVALGILSRRINWEQLTTMETIDVFIQYVRRIFSNIFSHAEQIAQAMIVRGFRGDSKNHKIHFLSDSAVGVPDIDKKPNPDSLVQYI